MADEKKTVEVGRALQRLMKAIGSPRSQVIAGRIFDAARVSLVDLAMALACDDDELLDEVVEDLDDAVQEVEEICPPK